MIDESLMCIIDQGELNVFEKVLNTRWHNTSATKKLGHFKINIYFGKSRYLPLLYSRLQFVLMWKFVYVANHVHTMKSNDLHRYFQIRMFEVITSQNSKANYKYWVILTFDMNFLRILKLLHSGFSKIEMTEKYILPP